MTKLTLLPADHECAYFGKVDYPVYKMEIVLDDSISLEDCIAKHEMNAGSKTPLTKEQQGMARRNAQRWDKYTSGNAYMLYLLNRTTAHSFRVQAYGKTPVDAVKRWYRGLDGNETWVRHCVKVVAVHACADTRTTEAGELLMGTQQNSFPY